MPAEDRWYTIHEHGGVAQSGVAGVSRFPWAMAQPVILGLPIDFTDYRFGVTLGFTHKLKPSFVSRGEHTRESRRKISLRTMRWIELDLISQ